MVILALQLLYLLFLQFDFLKNRLAIFSFSRFEGLQLTHFDVTAIDEVGAECFKCGQNLLLLFLLVRICVVHNTEITSSLFIDVGLWAIATNIICTDSAVMLPEEVGKIPQAYNAIWLLFIWVFLFQFDICIGDNLPDNVKLTIFWPPPTAKDFDCGYSLFIEEFYWESISSVYLFLRLIY
jgi:hypothetical protein